MGIGSFNNDFRAKVDVDRASLVDSLDEMDVDLAALLINFEYEVLTDIQDGRVSAVREHIKRYSALDYEKIYKGIGMGRSMLWDMKSYHTLFCGMVCRISLSKGMDRELALSMEKHYLNTMEKASDFDSALDIFSAMILDYAEKINEMSHLQYRSKAVLKSISYITSHLYEPLTLNSVAEAVGISPSYLSRRFTQETGMSIIDYIRDCKLDKAGIMLRNTDLPYLEISNMLGFSSQSFFIRKFKEYYGTTPQKYRKFGGGGDGGEERLDYRL